MLKTEFLMSYHIFQASEVLTISSTNTSGIHTADASALSVTTATTADSPITIQGDNAITSSSINQQPNVEEVIDLFGEYEEVHHGDNEDEDDDDDDDELMDEDEDDDEGLGDNDDVEPMDIEDDIMNSGDLQMLLGGM